MQNKRSYPPSQIRYQLEHPAITLYLSNKLKDTLDKLKKNRSYAEMIREYLEGTFNIEREIKTVPKSEAMIQYSRGFKEATNKFAQLENALNVIRSSLSGGWQMHNLSQGRPETQLLLFQ